MRGDNKAPFELEAAIAAFNDRYTYGDVIPHAAMWEILGVIMPGEKSEHGWASRQELLRLERLEDLKSALLERFNLDLETVHNYGHRAVEPRKQVGLAMDQTRDRIRRILNKGIMRVRYVDHTDLNDQEKVDQVNALAKLDAQKSMARKPRGGW